VVVVRDCLLLDLHLLVLMTFVSPRVRTTQCLDTHGLHAGEEWHAFTASWLTQVSMKPPLVMTAVRLSSRAMDLMQRSHVFTINFLTKDQKAIVKTFIQSSAKGHQPFAGHAFRIDKTGAPILEEAFGYLECETKRIVEGLGDHALVVAQVVNAELGKDERLLQISDTPWHYGG
jgi:flavin reductase (DIM6/NTAB) family NADH-FMN oxidoreductase RutF